MAETQEASVPPSLEAAAENMANSIGNKKAAAEKTTEKPENTLAADIEKTAEAKPAATVENKGVEKTTEATTDTEFEAFAQFLDEEKPAATTQATTAVTEKETTETDYTEYINKAKEHDDIMSIPLAKAVIDQIKSGKTDLNEIAATLGLENIDKKSSREVYEAGLKAEGYSDDDIASEMSDFDAIDNNVKKDRLAKPYRDAAKTAQAEKLKNLTIGLPQENKEEQARIAKVQTDASKELENKVNALKGKKYEGLLNITEDMIPQIMNEAGKYATQIFDKDGKKVIGYDLEGGIEAAILKLHKKSIIKAALTTGGTKTFLEWQAKRSRPNSNEHSTAAPVIEKRIKDDMDEAVKQVTGRN